VALRTFFKQSIPYLIWVILLTVGKRFYLQLVILLVCFNRVSHDNSQRYFYTQSVTDALTNAQTADGLTFNDINTVGGFWDWFTGPLASGKPCGDSIGNFITDQLPSKRLYWRLYYTTITYSNLL
jgi:hypothetical protein